LVIGAARDLAHLGSIGIEVASWAGWTIIHPLRRARGWITTGQAVGTLLSPRTLAPKSSLNADIGTKRAIDFVRLDLEEIRTVAHAHGATINDLLLTLVAGGLGELLAKRGEVTSSSELQALVPVALPAHDARGLANDISALFVRLPVGLDNPFDILDAIKTETAESKRHHQELVAAAFLHLIEPLPQGVLAKAAGLVQRQRFFNLIVTNVPGPTVPLFVLGSRVLEIYPVVPLAGNQGMGVAAVSYDGQLGLGVFSDPKTCPDVDAFCHGVTTTLRAMTERSVDGH